MQQLYKQCRKSNKNSIEFSLSIAEQRAVSLILAWSLAFLYSSAETSWDSNTSSLNKWKACNAQTLGLLIFNTRNLAELGINIDSTAAEAWTLYIYTYEKTSNMAQLNAKQTLWNMTYLDCTDFNNFIINICNK